MKLLFSCPVRFSWPVRIDRGVDWDAGWWCNCGGGGTTRAAYLAHCQGDLEHLSKEAELREIYAEPCHFAVEVAER